MITSTHPKLDTGIVNLQELGSKAKYRRSLIF